ncbi:MAG: serine/threonine protein kinase [Pyrinomonadaceae bacterium]
MAEEIIGKLFADKYLVDSLLKKSDLGDFYRCRHAFTERPVILQIMHGELAGDAAANERFSAAAKSVSVISHPNVLNVTDFGKAPSGRAFATLESTDGETLADALARDGQVPPTVALNVAEGAAAGLAAAQSAGLIHGNLDPSNILLVYGADGSKTVKLFNFGSSNAISASDRAVRDFAYVAPELHSGSDTPDVRSDVYSLGVVAYEMLAGDVPFQGDTPAEIINKHLEEAPPPLSAFRTDLSPGIEPVILKALAKVPEMRYQSADEFAQTIEMQAVNNGQNSNASAAVAAGEGNNIWKTGFIVLAGIAFLSVFLIYATSSKKIDPATVLQPDANGIPVQPINPATGVEEQSLAAMPGMTNDTNSNANTAMGVPPGTLPGGDGYNPWANGGAPPPGAPIQSFPQGGQTVTLPTGGQSPFTADDGQCIMQPSGLLLCPVPATNTAVRPTPTPRKPPANANTLAPVNTAVKPSPTPAAAKTPAPAKTPNTRPATNTATKPE